MIDSETYTVGETGISLIEKHKEEEKLDSAGTHNDIAEP